MDNKKERAYEFAKKWYRAFTKDMLTEEQIEEYNLELKLNGLEHLEVIPMFFRIAFEDSEGLNSNEVTNSTSTKFFKENNIIVGELTRLEFKGLLLLLKILDLDKIHYTLNRSAMMNVDIDASIKTEKLLKQLYDTISNGIEKSELILKNEFENELKNIEDDFTIVIPFEEEEIEALVLLFGELNPTLIRKTIEDMYIDNEFELSENLFSITDRLYNKLTDDLYPNEDILNLSDEIAEKFAKE